MDRNKKAKKRKNSKRTKEKKRKEKKKKRTKEQSKQTKELSQLVSENLQAVRRKKKEKKKKTMPEQFDSIDFFLYGPSPVETIKQIKFTVNAPGIAALERRNFRVSLEIAKENRLPVIEEKPKKFKMPKIFTRSWGFSRNRSKTEKKEDPSNLNRHNTL